MDFKVRISEAALTHFEEILAYSWANFPDTAERFGDALLNHLDLIERFPYIGSPVEGHPRVRQLVHTPILIYYRVHDEQRFVEVLTSGMDRAAGDSDLTRVDESDSFECSPQLLAGKVRGSFINARRF